MATASAPASPPSPVYTAPTQPAYTPPQTVAPPPQTVAPAPAYTPPQTVAPQPVIPQVPVHPPSGGHGGFGSVP
ncbi:MAG TPA: hypothetical protein VEF72_02560 [Mycobacterium sp.]|nr:hypothetical protein [Mycobacterium sp.]